VKSSGNPRLFLGKFSERWAPAFMGADQTFLYEFGEFTLDPAERRLMLGGKVVPLTPKALELLCVLVEESGRLLEKTYLMERLWTDAYVEEGNLADNISKIRQALGDSRKEPRFIETVSGRGYRFIAKVTKTDAAVGRSVGLRSEDASLVENNRTTQIDQSDEAALKSRRNRNPAFFQASAADFMSAREPGTSKRVRFTGHGRPHSKAGAGLWPSITLTRTFAISLFVVASSIGLFFYLWSFRGTGPSADTGRSIAVLPFKPLVASDRDEALELGMSDTLISGLSRLRQITVRPISSVRRYTDLEQDARLAGRELGVETVLDGNIQRTGERIRISARLLRVADGSTLWAETFDEKFTDIFEVQDSISEKIIGALAVRLTGDERHDLAKRYTADTAAYQLYIKGRFYWSKLSPDDLLKSIDFYQQAIEIDPNYALAYAGLADSYNLLGSYGVWPLKESHPKAHAAAEKALELDSELAEAHISLAAVIADYYWDWAEAEAHFKRGIELNPNYPVARTWHSQHLARMGRLDESIEEARRAQILEPLSSSANSHVGLALYRARRYEEAVAELQKALEFDPKAMDAHIFLGFVYVQQQKSTEAIEEFQSAVEISNGNPSMMALLAYGHAASGDREKALAILKEFGADAEQRAVSVFETAMIHIALGENDLAFHWLEKALAEKAWQIGFLRVEPIFDPLRSDPRFDDLMRRANLAS
jgi:TolB-like protein/DNA-binding winged helix-turn-helix (wHTH) protein